MSEARLDGAWRTDTYVVQGRSIPIQGTLLLSGGRWVTLFFVPGSEGEWASAEAGTFELDGPHLMFHHRHMFQGGGGRELLIDSGADRREACTIERTGDQLRIAFPSGNALHLKRLSDG